MAKKKSDQEDYDPLDIRHFLHQPHDKYVRALLEYRVSALQIIEYALGSELREQIDISGLLLSKASFIDEKLKTSLADVCYEGYTKIGNPFRICLLFEHKSEYPVKGLYAQLNRYIGNIWLEDFKQGREPTLSIPILIYHGPVPIEQETPERLFPMAGTSLLRFVPRFDYIILDLAAKSDEDIEQVRFAALRNIFLALKHSRDEEYLRKNWKKVIIFAPDFKQDPSIHFIIHATLVYMVSVSKTVQEQIAQADTVLSPDESEMVLPFVVQKWMDKGRQAGIQEGRQVGIQEGRQAGIQEGRQVGIQEGRQVGIQEGLEKGVLIAIGKYLRKNPHVGDPELAELFDIDVNLAAIARKYI